jgi:hypothetical protein
VKLVVRALHFAIGILAIFLGKYARIGADGHALCDLLHIGRARMTLHQLHRTLSRGHEFRGRKWLPLSESSRARFPKESIEIEILKQVALFCGAGLLVSLLMLTYGLDLSVGLF